MSIKDKFGRFTFKSWRQRQMAKLRAWKDRKVERMNEWRDGFFQKYVVKYAKFSFWVALVLFGGLLAEQKITINSVEAAKVEVKRETPPVLSKICGCESLGDRNSKGAQFDKNGKLIKLVNVDKTVDIGACGINEYHWEAKAAKLGFNIYEEAGNRAMAEWIFENHGTWPWNPSISCWNK